MTSEVPLDQLLDTVGQHLVRSRIMDSAYFQQLQSGEMTRDVFLSSQRQFFFAVRFFSRAMAALASRVVDSHERLSLIHNLAEEHGFVDDDDAANGDLSNPTKTRSMPAFQPGLAHDKTFRVFLKRLQNGRSELEVVASEQPAVHIFNLALWSVCDIEPHATAFACLGAIEFAFADISALIGQCVVERGWISRDDLIHYKLHAEIDKRHAGDFFATVADAWHTNSASRREVETGLTLGFYLFKRLYDDLLTEAEGPDRV